MTEFDVNRLENIPSVSSPQEARAAVDGVTETLNRETMLIGTDAGGVLALTVQSSREDTLMKAMFDTLSDSAKWELSGSRAGIFLTGFHGIDGEQLRSIADQDKDSMQPPTALRVAVSRFLARTGRDYVVGVGFLSESTLSPVREGHIASNGTAYYFPKIESLHWSEDFSGLCSSRSTQD